MSQPPQPTTFYRSLSSGTAKGTGIDKQSSSPFNTALLTESLTIYIRNSNPHQTTCIYKHLRFAFRVLSFPLPPLATGHYFVMRHSSSVISPPLTSPSCRTYGNLGNLRGGLPPQIPRKISSPKTINL
jgi:hypothetical protein